MSVPCYDFQRSFFDTDQFCTSLLSLPTAKRFQLFAEKVFPELMKLRPKLEAMYCTTNGRPAEEPVRMLAVLILQFMERLPDRQATEACSYDLRWKMALGMALDEPAFHPTSLVKFRQRILAHGLERLGFEGVLDSMRDAGYLRKKTRQRLDSTHVVGLVSWMSRLECVRETMRLALQSLERICALSRPEDWCVWWERYVESAIDFRTEASKLRVKMDQAGKDIRALLEWTAGEKKTQPATEALELLRRVYAENFKEKSPGVEQRRAQPPGAVHNPHDPEAQWCKKSTIHTQPKEWIGYKAQIAETVEEPVRQKNEPTKAIITAIVTQEATASDKSALQSVEQELAKNGQPLPEQLYVDAGYTSGKEIDRHESEGRHLAGPVQPAPKHGNRFSAEDFDIDIENRKAVCPTGKQNTQCSRLDEKERGIMYRFEWTTACHDCPMRHKCVGKRHRHRTLTVSEHHMHLQARRRAMKTEVFWRDMEHRNGIEGTISELARGYDLRRSRYRGQAKTRLQTLMIGAACNLKRWSRRLVWEQTHCTLPA